MDEQQGPAVNRRSVLTAAGVLVGAGVLVVITLPDQPGAEAERTSAVPSSTAPALPGRPEEGEGCPVRELLAEGGAAVISVAFGDDGSRAALWESGGRHALVIDGEGDSQHRELLDGAGDLAAVPGGYLVGRGADLRVVASDGTGTPVTTSAERVAPAAGDVVVDIDGSTWLYRVADAALHRPAPPRHGASTTGWVTPEGVLVTTTQARPGHGPVGRAVLRDGRWELSRIAAPEAVSSDVVGNGSRIAVVVVRSTAPSSPLVVQISPDAGTHWRSVPLGELGLSGYESAVVTHDGVVLLADAHGAVVRVPLTGGPERLGDAPGLTLLTASGSRVWGRDHRRARLHWTEDAGTTWHSAAPPGAASAESSPRIGGRY